MLRNRTLFFFFSAILYFFSFSSAQAETLTANYFCDPKFQYCTETQNDTDLPNFDIISEELIDIANTGGDTTLTNCTFGEFGGYDCNLGTAETPLDLHCTLDTSGIDPVVSCNDIELSNSATLTCVAGIYENCDLELETDTYCSINNDACSAYISNDAQCLLGIGGTNCPTDNERAFADYVIDTCYGGSLEEPVFEEVAFALVAIESVESLRFIGEEYPDFCDLNLTQEELEELARELVPTDIDAPIDTSTLNYNQIINYISNHLYNLRQGNNIASTNPSDIYLYSGGQLHSSDTLLASNDATSGTSNTQEAAINISSDGKLSIFMNMAFLRADEESTEHETESETNMETLTIGVDYRYSHDLVIGGAVSYSTSTVDFGFNKKSRLDSTNFNLIAYVSHYLEGWWMDGSIMLGTDRYDQSRLVNCAVCLITVSKYDSDFEGYQFGLNYAAGYDFTVDRWNISPFIQLNHGNITIDPYEESVDGFGIGAELAIDKQQRDYTTLSVGNHFRYTLNTAKSVYIPYLRVLFNHDLEDDLQVISGHFVKSNFGSFELEANALDRNFATVATGFSFQLPNGHSGFFDLETIENHDQIDQYRVTAGWRSEF